MPRGVGMFERATIQRHLWDIGALGPLGTTVDDDLTAYTMLNASATAGQADPEGMKRAYKIEENTNTGGHGVYASRTYAGIAYTAVTVAKSAERSILSIDYFDASSDYAQNYNLGTGVIGSAYSGALSNPTQTSLGFGWNLCTAQFTGNSNPGQALGFYTRPADAYAAFAGTTGSGVSLFKSGVWGRALSQAEVDRMAGYYAWRFAGHNNTLPGTHRYKNRPPLSDD